MNDAPDSTALPQATHHSRRLRVLAGLLLVALGFAAGCGGTSRATLRDEGKSAAELRAMLADADPEVQARGALGLSRIGPEARDTVPELIPLLKSPSPLARQNAALALAAIGPDAKDAVPALTEALKDSEWAVRRQSAIALGAIGPAAKPALPALKKLDSDPHKPVRDAAKQARDKIGG
jgi:HEAT repeat protein